MFNDIKTLKRKLDYSTSSIIKKINIIVYNINYDRWLCYTWYQIFKVFEVLSGDDRTDKAEEVTHLVMPPHYELALVVKRLCPGAI